MTLSRQMNECPVFPTSPEAWHQTAGCGRLLQTEAVFLFHTEHGKALGTGVFSLCSASNQRWVTGQVTEPSLSSSFTCEHNELISFQGLKAAVLKLHLASDTCHTYQVPHHTSSAWLATSPGPVHWKGLPEITQCSFHSSAPSEKQAGRHLAMLHPTSVTGFPQRSPQGTSAHLLHDGAPCPSLHITC